MLSPKVIRFSSMIFMLVFLTNCATIDYVGNSYPSTGSVDIYYSDDQVEQNFEVLGHAVGFREGHETIINKLISEAKIQGADAIIITGIDVDNADISNTKKVAATFIKYQWNKNNWTFIIQLHTRMVILFVSQYILEHQQVCEFDLVVAKMWNL